MSNKTNFTSLAQLSSYSGLKEFLEQYHSVVKEEFGQFLGINKALICLSKVLKNYENKHQMIADLKTKESDNNLFTIRKELISITDLSKDGSIIDSNEVHNFTNWDDALKFVQEAFEESCIANNTDIVELMEGLEQYLEDDFIEEIESLDNMDDVFKVIFKSSIDIYDYITEIEKFSHDTRDMSIETNYIDFKVSQADIIDSLSRSK